MANQISLEGDQSQTEETQLCSGNFPFTSEQCQQLISLLNTHAFSFGSCEGIHSANSAINPVATSGNTCLLFEECVFKHATFYVCCQSCDTKLLSMMKLGFLILRLQITQFILLLYSPKSPVPYLPLFNYLMVRKLLSLT